MKAYFELLRPLNGVMAAIAVLIGYWIGLGEIAFSQTIGLALVSVFLIAGAGQTINDYFDRHLDKKLKPHRPLPSGRVRPHHAILYSFLLFVVGILLALFLTRDAFFIALFMSLALAGYSAFMRKAKWLGNFFVAFGTGVTIIFGASLTGNYGIVLWLFWPLFFANVGREISKDLEDVQGDKGFKLTFPMLVSESGAQIAVYLSYLLSALFAFYVFASGIVPKLPFISIALLAVVGFAYSAWLVSQEKYRASQKWSKISMIIALVAYLSIPLV
ncbi:MAG: geranylgeranylglycerol-phosphate geranylgeranyltransferase [Candidatus Diapherotrites archaeon]